MVNAGRILILTKGAWDALTSYDALDLVSYNKIAYLARQASVGVNPSSDTTMLYWQPFGSVSDIATTSTPGLVMPDGDTITIDATGLIQVDLDAEDVEFFNTTSGLSATDVQGAIDELKSSVDGDIADLQSDKEDKPTELTATLSVGATSVSFTNAAITATAKIDVYTDTFGVNPTNQSVSGTTLTLTFKAQAAAVSVKVLVRG